VRRSGILWTLSILVPLLVATSAHAQERYTFTGSVLGGFSGSLDQRSDSFGHTAWELGLGMVSDERTQTVLRVGRMNLGDGTVPGLRAPKIEYAVAAGEYHFPEPAYDAGIFLGLGGYRLDGKLPFGDRKQETAIGLELGFTGDFDVTRHLSLVAEVGFHYVFFHETQFYGEGLGGVAIHF
jgi:hypothetical protein